MSDAFVQLPYAATTSGDLLDATSLVIGANTVKRERMVIGNDTSSHVAIVTTSGALSVARTPTSLTSGLITLSSAPSISSGVITLSSAIGISSGLITLSSAIGISSGLITLTGANVVTNASSGLVQVLQSTGAWAITGASTDKNIVGSTGQQVVVTSSGAMSVTMSTAGGGAGSTAVNLPTVSAAGFAPVTSSGGLLTQFAAHTVVRIDSTIGAPVAPTQVTTAAGRLFSVTISATGAAAHALKLFNDTGSGSSSTGYTYFFATPAAAGLTQIQFSAGAGVVFADGGLRGAFVLGTTSTSATTAAFNGYVEYQV